MREKLLKMAEIAGCDEHYDLCDCCKYQTKCDIENTHHFCSDWEETND